MLHGQRNQGNVRLLGIFTFFLTDSSTAGDAGTMLSAFGSWLQALWDHDDPGGPSILFQPTELSMTIQAW